MELTADVLSLGVLWYVVFLFSLTLHEAAHAWASERLGDSTASAGGQVTLNPLPHIRQEPIGTVAIPLISYLLSGWMIGWASAPYDPAWADRYPRRAAWMALAGPVSNLLLVLVAALFIRLGLAAEVFVAPETAHFSQVTIAAGPGLAAGFAKLLSIVFSLNLLLFAFNLLPLPPLDGSGVLPLLMPEEMARRYLEVMRQPTFALLGLIVAWNFFGQLFSPLHTLALNLLYPGLGYH